MFPVKSITIYWQNIYMGRILSALRKLFTVPLSLLCSSNYQIFQSSKFMKMVSFTYRPQALHSKGLSFIIRAFWILIIISASFSFKITLESIGNESIFVKFGDLVFVFLILIALFKIKDWKSTPLDLPFVIFALIMMLAIYRGIAINTISRPSMSVLYLLKIIQYFLLFYLMFNLISNRNEARFYAIVIFATALLIGVYGIIEHFRPYPHYPFSYPFFYRIYERGYFYHDANHFAAYLMFMASLIFGLLLFTSKHFLKKIGLFVIFLFLSLPLFWTYSRAAYSALFVSLLVISGIKSKRILIPTLALFTLFIFLFASPAVIDRIYSFKTAILSNNPHTSSIAYRFQQIRYALETIKQYPFLGIGLAARSRVFYENQFIMFISEIGILGLIAFFSIILTIFSAAISLYRSTESNLIKGFSAGYMGGLLGLLLEGNTLVIFLISRVMIPFWLVTAIIFWLLSEQKKGTYAKSHPCI